MPYDGRDRRSDGNSELKWISKQLEGIHERMKTSHMEAKEQWDNHIYRDHKELLDRNREHEKDGESHAVTKIRLDSHSRRFWWLVGFGSAIGAVGTWLAREIHLPWGK